MEDYFNLILKMLNIVKCDCCNENEYLNFILNLFFDLTKSKHGIIYLYDEVKNIFIPASASKELQNINDPEFFLYLEEIIRHEKGIIINDYQNLDAIKRKNIEFQIKISNLLALPIFVNNKIFSVVILFNKEQDYTEEDIIKLKILMEIAFKEFEKRRINNQLRSEKEFSLNIIENSPVIIVGLKKNLKIFMFNKFSEELTGYKKNEVIGKNWIDIFIDDKDKEKIYQYWNKIITKRIKLDKYENFILTKNKDKKFISWNNNFIIDQEREEFILSIGIDITEKYETYKKLQIQNNRLLTLLSIGESLVESKNFDELFAKIPSSISMLMDNISVAVYLLKDNILFLNSTFPDLPQNFPEDLRYANLDDHPHIKKAIENKTYIYIENVNNVKLTEKEENIVKIRDLKTILYFPLYYHENIFGVIIIGIQHEMAKFTEEDINLFNTITKFSSIKIEEIKIEIENQSVIKQLKIANEKQEELLKRLHQSEEKFRRLLENAQDIIFRYEIKPLPKFSYINEAVTKIAGYIPDQYYLDPEFVFNTVFDEDKNLVYDIIKGRVDFTQTFNIRFITKNNHVIYLSLNIVPIYDEKGDLIAIECIARDITEKIKSEEEKQKLHDQILQIQKIESIGMLAGGVAHDFNNMLAIILGYSEQIKSRLVEIGQPDYEINQIINTAQNAKEIILQLLAFGRKQTLELKVVNLNNIIKSIEQLIKKTIREDIELQIILDNNLDNILADPVQIQQIIINMVVNSRDALADGGKIIIETAVTEFDDKYTATHAGTKNGRHVMLAISDNGAGMDKETLNRIFEPFFTTKEKGKGSGLGLATVYGIVKQLEGNIFVYSEIGVGTTFKVYFPSSNKKEEISSMNEDKSENVRTSGEKILLVEDDENLRKVTKLMLEKLNYNVTVAKGPFDALSIIEKNGNLFDCILTDVIMPEMNGRQLVDKIKEKYPKIKVLFMSGYTDNIIVHHGVLDRGIEFIQKPFMMNEIGLKLKKILINKDKNNN